MPIMLFFPLAFDLVALIGWIGSTADSVPRIPRRSLFVVAGCFEIGPLKFMRDFLLERACTVGSKTNDYLSGLRK
jgi:hypothetical protein